MKLTPSRLNVADLMLRELVASAAADGLPVAQQEAFQRALEIVTELRGARITARPEDHTPVCPAPGVIGCACGFTPRRAARMSQMATAYLSHIGKLGLPRHSAVDPVQTYGPQAGQKWSEIYR